MRLPGQEYYPDTQYGRRPDLGNSHRLAVAGILREPTCVRPVVQRSKIAALNVRQPLPRIQEIARP